MPVVPIDPKKGPPVPYGPEDETPLNFMEALAVTANTVDLLAELGGTPEISYDDVERTKTLLKDAVEHKKTANLNTPATAYAAREFIRQYAHQLAMDASDLRSAVTTKLMEIANCGDTRFELKALELLGKHSDVGLFTERSEITVNYKTSADLENAIKERVKRLLDSNTIDVTPLERSLELELAPPVPQAPQKEEKRDAA